ncbi:MAG: hypothetical protein M4579_004929 [Chaenotheca gracillima]|nr:MAG: hypothetical protein M4579_004929 [Chaenotheca gracillima]
MPGFFVAITRNTNTSTLVEPLPVMSCSKPMAPVPERQGRVVVKLGPVPSFAANDNQADEEEENPAVVVCGHAASAGEDRWVSLGASCWADEVSVVTKVKTNGLGASKWAESRPTSVVSLPMRETEGKEASKVVDHATEEVEHDPRKISLGEVLPDLCAPKAEGLGISRWAD